MSHIVADRFSWRQKAGFIDEVMTWRNESYLESLIWRILDVRTVYNSHIVAQITIMNSYVIGEITCANEETA
jgi:hypothetical protein